MMLNMNAAILVSQSNRRYKQLRELFVDMRANILQAVNDPNFKLHKGLVVSELEDDSFDLECQSVKVRFRFLVTSHDGEEFKGKVVIHRIKPIFFDEYPSEVGSFIFNLEGRMDIENEGVLEERKYIHLNSVNIASHFLLLAICGQ